MTSTGGIFRELSQILREGTQAAPSSTPTPATEASVLSESGRERTFYRIVASEQVRLEDFTANLAKCLPRRGPERDDPLLWAGLSMYDTAEQATQTARRYEGRLGNYLAQLLLPPEGDQRVFVRQTLRPGHFTVMCCAATCVSFVRDVRPIVGL